MRTDTELYNEYLSVNAAALEKLMELYSDRLTPYINGYVRNIHDAEDLMIDVFAYLVCKKPHIKDSFNSYMYKAARNRALSFLRKSKRIVFLADEKIDFCIEDRIHIKERDERLYGCMDELFCALRFIRRIRETMTVTKPAENSGSGEYAEGETVTIDAGERSSYTFDGRTADKSVSVENEKSAVTTFMMINEDVAWNENDINQIISQTASKSVFCALFGAVLNILKKIIQYILTFCKR